MKNRIILLAALFLPGCVGGSLSDTSEFEMFPLRAATKSEGQDLKRCLKSAHNAQERSRKVTGHYTRAVNDLPLDTTCSGLRLSQKGTATGYEIRAEIHEDETAVRWSVNEKGLIEEHLDSESTPDLEL